MSSIQYHEIEQKDWRDFFEQFSWLHRGWLITIKETAHQTAAFEDSFLPLKAVKTNVRDGFSAISIETDGPANFRGKEVCDPKRVIVETENGTELGIILEDKLGQFTSLRFRGIAAPERLDDISRADH